MEVRAFCIASLTVMILLCAQDQEVDAAFLRISPNRLQFFEYELFTLYCEGVFYCDVTYKTTGMKPSCCTTNNRTSRGPNCTIKNVYQDDSGKYWCEEGGERRNIININVTSGSVILESPAHPVMEGEDVTLSCRTKISSSNIRADFYKDGVNKWRSSTGNLSIKTVSMSDQGFYKCQISGVGESPQSWLSVEAVLTINTSDSDSPANDIDDHQDSNPASSSSTTTPWIIISILLMLLLLVVGLLHLLHLIYSGRFRCGRVSVQGSVAEASPAICATVTKNRKKEDENGDLPVYYALGQSGTPHLAESIVPSSTPDPADCDVYYSTIQDVAER